MAEAQLSRALPLADAMHGGANVSISAAPAASRVSLRAGDDAVAALSEALGVALPRKPKTSASAKNRHALWLGPDEWLVFDEAGDVAAACAGAEGLFSAVDISHRNTAIVVAGRAAADVLNAGCRQDLSLEAFPVGACSRTVLGKIEAVLYRTGETRFRVECWRSFSEYAFGFLKDAARGL